MMVGKYLKKCPICGGPTKRAKTNFVIGNVIVEHDQEADVCTKCGEEFYTAEQVMRTQEKATKLGIMDAQLEEERELKKVGGSLFVSIPSAMAKIMNLAPDEKVKMKLTKQGISITKAEK